MDRLRCHSVWLIVLVGLALPGVGWSYVSVPEGYRTIAMEHDIPYTVLYAVALTESATQIDQGDLYRPWPWTLNVAGRGYFFDTRLAAWQALKNWLREGQVSIDIGLLILVHALVTKKDVIKQDSMLGCRSGLLIDRVRRCV